MTKPHPTKGKPKPQGKLDERIIIGELLKKPKKKNWEIAKMAGSIAKEKDVLTRTLERKVRSSVVIQKALERHRNDTLNTHAEIQKELADRIREEKLSEKLTANEVYTNVIKEGLLVSSLTKQEATAASKGDTNIQINIIQPKDE